MSWLGVNSQRGSDPRVTLTLSGHGVVTAMRVAVATGAFLFDVGHFSRAAYVTIPADDAAARQRSEAEEPDDAHW